MNIKIKSFFLIFFLFVILYVFCYTKENEIAEQKTKEDKTEYEIILKEVNKNIEDEIKKEIIIEEPRLINLGEFKLTAYCSCEICCGKWSYNRPDGTVYGSIGEELKEGYSIAVDPSVISYRTEVVINGHTYKAQDCGGGIKGSEIDIYFEDHDDALEFGVQYVEVFLK